MAIEHLWHPLRSKVVTRFGENALCRRTDQGGNESFTATLTKGVGGAWACQSRTCIKERGRIGGNVLDFVAAMEQCSVRDAAIKLQLWFLVPAAGESRGPVGKEPHAESSAGKEPEGQHTPEKNDGVGESESNKPLTFTLQKYRLQSSVSYREESRKKLQNVLESDFSGKGSMHDRIVIPIHNRRLIAYRAGRSIDGSEPRYKFPAGFHKSLELFNLHHVRGEPSIVLVEGFFDCMKITQAGFPCVALMGSTMSSAQENLLADFSHVVVMLDGDEAGSRRRNNCGSTAACGLQNGSVELPDGVQPDQLSADELHAAAR